MGWSQNGSPVKSRAAIFFLLKSKFELHKTKKTPFHTARVYKISQKLDKPNSKTYIGSGKLDEIVIAIHAYDADLVIFNDELSPSQLRNFV